VHLEDDTIGVLIEMKVREAAHDRSPAIVGEYPAANQHSTDTAGGLLPGRSLIWKRTCREIATVRVLPEPVLVVGERGTGKTNAAKLLAGDGQGPVETLDAALATHAGRDWVASARRKLINRGRLVVTHLDALPADLQNALAALLREAEGFGGRLVATGDRSVGSARSRLGDHFPVWLELPPLRERTEDIADIAPFLLARSAVPGHPKRLQPSALQALMTMEWPGAMCRLRGPRAADDPCSKARLEVHSMN
jgi:sigma-54 dependent transcriptional regulator, acetoin dehydrogenase operon transcriptional activator AcoR